MGWPASHRGGVTSGRRAGRPRILHHRDSLAGTTPELRCSLGLRVETDRERRCSISTLARSPGSRYIPVRGHQKGGGSVLPRLSFRFVLVTSLVGQPSPGTTGRRLISMPVIDIEIARLVVMPVNAPSASPFMDATIAPHPPERNNFHNPPCAPAGPSPLIPGSTTWPLRADATAANTMARLWMLSAAAVSGTVPVRTA